MAAQVDSGLALLLGLILVLAGVPKLRDPRGLQRTLRQLYPAIRRRPPRGAIGPARAVAGTEIAVGATVAGVRGPVGLVAAGATLALCIGFLFALRRAIRVGAHCSCFGRLSRTPAGGREVGRAFGLIAIAATVAVLRARAPHAPLAVGWPSMLAFLGGGAGLLVAMSVGARRRPADGTLDAGVADVLGFDGSLVRPDRPMVATPLVGREQLRRAAEVVRAAPETTAALAEPRLAGCGAVRWEQASAALNPNGKLISISVTTEGGCLLVACLPVGHTTLSNVAISVPLSVP